jgi:hypothetical protein
MVMYRKYLKDIDVVIYDIADLKRQMNQKDSYEQCSLF